MITRKDILAHLDRNVRMGFTVGLTSYTSQRGSFVSEMSSPQAYEVFADLGVTPWPVQNGGRKGAAGEDERTEAQKTGDIHAGGMPQSGDFPERAIMIYPVDWEVVIPVTHNAIDDDLTGDIERKARSAGIQFQRHMDWVGFDALNGGDGTDWGYCYDGNEFFDTAHADPNASYTTSQSNLGTSTLTLDNFKTIKIAAAKLKDNIGQPMGLSHNLLVVPPDLEYEAAQICTNVDAYDTANREKNPYAGSTNYLVAPGGWMDTTAWVIVDTSTGLMPLMMIVRKAPSLSIWDEELAADGGIRYYKLHARYNIAYLDWRLAYMGKS